MTVRIRDGKWEVYNDFSWIKNPSTVELGFAIFLYAFARLFVIVTVPVWGLFWIVGRIAERQAGGRQ